MGLKIDEIIYNITSDDFIDDEVLFDAPWVDEFREVKDRFY